jgi:hypothetical protein
LAKTSAVQTKYGRIQGFHVKVSSISPFLAQSTCLALQKPLGSRTFDISKRPAVTLQNENVKNQESWGGGGWEGNIGRKFNRYATQVRNFLNLPRSKTYSKGVG